MSDPDRVSVAFIWDTESPHFSRRTFMKTMGFVAAAGFAAACGGSGKSTKTAGTTAPPDYSKEPKALNFYNWTDYIDDKTIPNFQKQTGIKVVYDNYSSNDELFAKLGSKRPPALAAERKRDKAISLIAELDEQISEIPATSIEGMIAKARCAKAYDEDCYPYCDDPLSMFGASIVRDLLAMAEAKPAA